MTAMEALFASGRVVDAVLALLLLEALALALWRARRAAMPWATLAAGAGLLLAWRLTLASASWAWVAAALAAAGVAHGWDLWRLWRAR